MKSSKLSLEDRGSFWWCVWRRTCVVRLMQLSACIATSWKEGGARRNKATPRGPAPQSPWWSSASRSAKLDLRRCSSLAGQTTDGSDLSPEYTVLDLTVPRTALASCADCRACGACGSMSRSTVLLHLTRVARLRGRAIWLMVCLRCFLSLLPRKSTPPVLFQFASHRNSNFVGWTLSARVGQTRFDALHIAIAPRRLHALHSRRKDTG